MNVAHILIFKSIHKSFNHDASTLHNDDRLVDCCGRHECTRLSLDQDCHYSFVVVFKSEPKITNRVQSELSLPYAVANAVSVRLHGAELQNLQHSRVSLVALQSNLAK